MSRPIRAVIAAGTMLMAVSACATAGAPAPGQPDVLRAEQVARVMPAADAPVPAVAAGIANLGYRLGQSAEGNWVISPASIAVAFAMVRAGAGGQTAAEIDRAFGFPATGLHGAFNAVTRQLVTADGPPPSPPPTPAGPPDQPLPPVLCLGDAVFLQRDYAVGADFLHTLAEQYGAGVHLVDFVGGTAAPAIDAWVKRQTAGRIDRLFDEIPDVTRLVLANTVYLRAAWEQTFDPKATTSAAFHRADASTVRVPTMTLRARLPYAQGDGWVAVELPYVGGRLAMRIMLPTGGPGASHPNGLLAPAVQAAVTNGWRTRQVTLAMPRWDFATRLQLNGALQALGIVTAFSDQADFDAINPDLLIGEVIHRANITVDEGGTEAAAVTGIRMDISSIAPQPVTVTVDHPFAFAIVDTATGVPVFEGHVADPSVHP